MVSETKTKKVPLNRVADEWKLQLRLQKGVYSYKIVADGHWLCDSNAEQTTDENNNHNNCLRVGTCPAEFSWPAEKVRRSAAVAGTFSSWKPIPLRQNGAVWSTEIAVPIGQHRYKFVVDDEYASCQKWG